MINPVIDFSNDTPNFVQNVSDLLTNVVNQYIVNPGGSSLSGYVFDIIGDEENGIDSEITDHYLENNNSIQDHIANRPERFTVKGFVGELTDILSTETLAVLSEAVTLGTLGGFNPTFAAQAQQTYNQLTSVTSEITQAYNQAQNFYNAFSQTSTASTKQQQAFSFFYGMWQTRQLFTIQTPYNTFYNMAIESLRALQRDDNRYVSDFSITFKAIRFVSTTTTVTNPVNPNGLSTNVTKATNVNNITGRALDNNLASNPVNFGNIAGQSTVIKRAIVLTGVTDMKLINTLTDDSNQTMTITMDDGSLMYFSISYWQNQQGWYYNFSHPLLTQGWRRLVNSPNVLRQFRNVINFGLYCSVTDGLEPVFISDFVNGRVQLYTLNSSDILLVEENIIG